MVLLTQIVIQEVKTVETMVFKIPKITGSVGKWYMVLCEYIINQS